MPMRAYLLSSLLLLVVAFCFATTIEPWHQNWEGGRTKTDNLMEVALGDSRQLLARHFILKADSYFHNGYAPSIFDHKDGADGSHMAGGEAEGEESYLGKPKDFLDAFGRNFFPSRHTHLGHHEEEKHGVGEKDEHHGDGEEPESESESDEREILPWLKLSLRLDPKRVDTYVVAAYWLRTSLKKVDEAELLLREGLQNAPGNPELLFELGRVQLDERHDVERARNLWELAVKSWSEQAAGSDNPNIFVGAQLLANLALLEEKAGRKKEAIQYLMRLQAISPNKGSIAKWIENLQAAEK